MMIANCAMRNVATRCVQAWKNVEQTAAEPIFLESAALERFVKQSMDKIKHCYVSKEEKSQLLNRRFDLSSTCF